ncbi:MAG: nucleotidyltransferase family protein [Anaerolineae bacterium]
MSEGKTEDTIISAEEMAAYRATLERRTQASRQALAERRNAAWDVAHQATALLRERFGATKVVAFGSLVHGQGFSPSSDIDLAVWGVTPDAYFTAVAQLQDLSAAFKIDLVDMAHCKDSLREVIEKGGIEL